MFYTYVLHSESSDKIHIGFSSDIHKRLESHNSELNTGWTRSFRPWKIVYFEEHETKSEAMKREKQLKTARGREFYC